MIRKHYSIPETLEEQVRHEAKSTGVSASHVVAKALTYYFKNEGRDYPDLTRLFDAVVKGNLQSLAEEINNMNVAIKHMSKESQMGIQFWNNHHIMNGNGTLVTTDVNKSHEVQQAEAHIQNRILHAQQNKHS